MIMYTNIQYALQINHLQSNAIGLVCAQYLKSLEYEENISIPLSPAINKEKFLMNCKESNI